MNQAEEKERELEYLVGTYERTADCKGRLGIPVNLWRGNN
jgi:hypothetical protein